MRRVVEECERVTSDSASDPVHDLRLALRRCRSLADGLMALDPDPDWKAMKKSGKRLFQRLGDLRDIHVMQEWIERFVERAPSPATPTSDQSPPPTSYDSGLHSGFGDPAAESLLTILKTREQEQEHEAHAPLEEFDRKQWRQWSKSLPARAARFRPGNPLFKHLSLERWTAARELYTRALRNRSQTAFHSLRIAIKRFGYIAGNLLPADHKAATI